MKKIILYLCVCLLWSGSGIMAQQDSSWTLEACIEFALNENIQVRKSALSNQSYGYYADQARAQRFPNVNATIGQNFNWSKGNESGETGFSGSNSSNYSINSSVTVFNASKLTNQIRQAELDIQSGQYNLETTRESISLSILDAFLQVLYAEESVKNSEKQIESTSEQLNLAGERLTLQVISQSDYLQVKSQLATEKLNLANAKNQLAIAKVNLMQLMELPVTDDFEIAHPNLGASIDQKRNPNVQSIFDTAMAIKPQIKAAAVNKEIAALDEKIAKAGYFPTLSASAGISSGFSSQSDDPYFDQIDNGISPTAGLSLSIPIYQKKQVKTNVAIAKIGYQNAELSETDTKNQLRKSIEQACLDVTSAQIEYDANIENYESTRESAALSDEKFTLGFINSVDYMVSKTNLIVAESQLLQSKYNLIYSYKVLDFYLGIPITL